MKPYDISSSWSNEFGVPFNIFQKTVKNYLLRKFLCDKKNSHLSRRETFSGTLVVATKPSIRASFSASHIAMSEFNIWISISRHGMPTKKPWLQIFSCRICSHQWGTLCMWRNLILVYCNWIILILDLGIYSIQNSMQTRVNMHQWEVIHYIIIWIILDYSEKKHDKSFQSFSMMAHLSKEIMITSLKKGMEFHIPWNFCEYIFSGEIYS